MALKVEVISKEIIKPSTPTPLHRKTMKLSLLDQHTPPIPILMIAFYPAKKADQDNEKKLDHLKKSLAEVFTDFYPLAGRISGNQFIDCNDEGIYFIESQVTVPMSHVVSHTEANQLSQLLPVIELDPKALLFIQANHFECGGLAIAVRVSHKVCDASSLSLFFNHWAAVCSGGSKSIYPEFDTASIFPPLDGSPTVPPVNRPTQNLVSKRFVFDAPNIAALKAKISDDLTMASPTRVEAISALLWGCAINVARMRKCDIKSQFALAVPVNLRGRLVPPLSSSWFGNLVLGTLAKTNTESHPQLQFLAGQIREAIRRFDGDYTTQLKTLDAYMAYLDHMTEVHELCRRDELELFSLTSWCRFPFYEADFGWGEPIWVTYADFSKNLIALMDTKCGHGVEAWVTLDEEDMARFQCEPDLIVFTSTSSTPN